MIPNGKSYPPLPQGRRQDRRVVAPEVYVLVPADFVSVPKEEEFPGHQGDIVERLGADVVPRTGQEEARLVGWSVYAGLAGQTHDAAPLQTRPRTDGAVVVRVVAHVEVYASVIRDEDAVAADDGVAQGYRRDRQGRAQQEEPSPDRGPLSAPFAQPPPDPSRGHRHEGEDRGHGQSGQSEDQASAQKAKPGGPLQRLPEKSEAGQIEEGGQGRGQKLAVEEDQRAAQGRGHGCRGGDRRTGDLPPQPVDQGASQGTEQRLDQAHDVEEGPREERLQHAEQVGIERRLPEWAAAPSKPVAGRQALGMLGIGERVHRRVGE